MFTADGDVRRGDEDDSAAHTPLSDAVSEPPPPPRSEPPPAQPDEAPAADDGGPELPVDFTGFLVSLATQAMQALAQQPPRLREARALVSILEMLKDKSEGRRTAEENEVMEALLYQLRMGYLERQRAGEA